MSNESVLKTQEKLHGEIFGEINNLLIDLQDSAATVQAKDAFWHAFEYARCNPDERNIQMAWEQYRVSRDNIK